MCMFVATKILSSKCDMSPLKGVESLILKFSMINDMLEQFIWTWDITCIQINVSMCSPIARFFLEILDPT